VVHERERFVNVTKLDRVEKTHSTLRYDLQPLAIAASAVQVKAQTPSPGIGDSSAARMPATQSAKTKAKAKQLSSQIILHQC